MALPPALRGVLLEAREAHVRRRGVGAEDEAFIADIERAILACVLEENEACAAVADKASSQVDWTKRDIAQAIRARRKA